MAKARVRLLCACVVPRPRQPPTYKLDRSPPTSSYRDPVHSVHLDPIHIYIYVRVYVYCTSICTGCFRVFRANVENLLLHRVGKYRGESKTYFAFCKYDIYNGTYGNLN